MEGLIMNNNSNRHIRIFSLIALYIFIQSLFISTGCNSENLENRIQRVENGLIKSGTVNRKTAKKLRLVDRMNFYQVPGVSIAVINNNRIEWAKGYGVLDARETKPVTPETLFQAASISKPLTAMAALRIVQDGLIDLDEDVNNKLVSWKVPENEFTSKKRLL